MKKIPVFLCVCLFFSVISLEGQTPGDAQSLYGDSFGRMGAAFRRQEATSVDAYYLGRAVAANILAAYKPYTTNPELTRYLNKICQTIVINSAYPDLYNGYHVMILDSPEFNAFATPAGHIFITKGLVEAASSEDMLAALIAHELAHIMLKHGLSMIEDMRLHDDMSVMADRAVQFAGNTEAAARFSYFRNSVAATVNALVKNGFSQEQEFEADEGAVVLLAASGYNPQALLGIIRVLMRVQSSQNGGFNSTHPSPAQRLERAREYVRQYQVQDNSSSREQRFKNK